MSRVGKVPVVVPKGVAVTIEGSSVSVKGIKGELSRTFHPDISIRQEDGSLVVMRPSDSRMHRALHGLSRALLANMVDGVSKGFERSLEINGVGYKAQKAGEKLVLSVGFSHPVEFDPPKGISISVEGANRIKVSGADKETVGEITTQIRAIRPADPYKGKGIKYLEERLKLKPGKAGRAAMKK